jgi:hypothetical protein
MTSQLVGKLQQTFALLDDDALASLANRGLVRRARKDLEAKQPTILGEDQERLELEVDGCTVLLVDRPSDAHCTCPASGTCRHILAAILFVASQGESAPATPFDLRAELSGIATETIQTWAGKALVDRATAEVAKGISIEFREGNAPQVRLSDLNVECLWVPGLGLEGMLCDCHTPRVCLHRVIAVVAWQIQLGLRQPPALDKADLESSVEAPRTRDEVRASVTDVTEELVAQGLSKLSPATVGRMRTLATSAHGVDLPALERLVRALADESRAWLDRTARASDEAILSRSAVVHALAQALADPKPALVGVHRSQYERVRNLDVVGVGARCWRSASGYTGLTVYFWDSRSSKWNTWTDARPIGTAGFDAVGRFRAAGPWPGCDSPAMASGSYFRLPSAWRSRAGRLSARSGTSAVRLGPTSVERLPPAIDTWKALVPTARDALVVGLSDHDETASLVLLRPTAWQKADFDVTRQELVRAVVDSEGRMLPLVLQQTPENQAAISALEGCSPSGEACVFGSLRVHRGWLACEPIAILDAGGVTSLGLSRATDVTSRAPVASADLTEAGDVEEGQDLESREEPTVSDDDNPVHRVLSAIWNELEAASAAGLRAYRGWPRLEELSARADKLGLSHCANSIAGMKQSSSESASLQVRAGALLDAAWVVRLCLSASAVQHAAAKMG